MAILVYLLLLSSLGAAIYRTTTAMAAQVNQHLPVEEQIGVRKGRSYITIADFARLQKSHKHLYPESAARCRLRITEMLLAVCFFLLGVRVVFFNH